LKNRLTLILYSTAAGNITKSTRGVQYSEQLQVSIEGLGTFPQRWKKISFIVNFLPSFFG
jgi:hypothetical protein